MYTENNWVPQTQQTVTDDQ